MGGRLGEKIDSRIKARICLVGDVRWPFRPIACNRSPRREPGINHFNRQHKPTRNACPGRLGHAVSWGRVPLRFQTETLPEYLATWYLLSVRYGAAVHQCALPTGDTERRVLA